LALAPIFALPSLREIVGYAESGGNKFLQNIIICLLNYTASLDIGILASAAKI